MSSFDIKMFLDSIPPNSWGRLVISINGGQNKTNFKLCNGWLARVGTHRQDKEILFTLTWHINIRGSVSPCSGLYSIVCQANEQACSNNSPTKESLACGNGTCDTFMRMSFVSQMNLHEKKDAEKTFHDDI